MTGKQEQGQPQAAHKFDVSLASLEFLEQGLNRLMENRQGLMSELTQIDAAIQQQRGGIVLMKNLLDGLAESAPPPPVESA